jgi:NTE family protein
MDRPEDTAPQPNRRPVRLALQGGGAHGAFTWGVLDRLLEEGGLGIEAVSGASAGAMNAVVLSDGLAGGGPEGARRALRDFWTAVGRAAAGSPFRKGPVDRWTARPSRGASPGFLVFEGLSRYISPYDVNPLGLNPLRDILAANVDFDRLNAQDAIDVHVTATHVGTGMPRVFSRGALSVDAVMASACLPQLFPAVEIDGEAYWDGGFTGNPSLFPLVSSVNDTDVIIVQINPIERRAIPHRARDIIDRMNEITFNASLVKELAAMRCSQRLAEPPRPGVRLHRIHGGDAMEAFAASSKLDADARSLARLFNLGRHRAHHWVGAHGDQVGRVSTLDLDALFGAGESTSSQPAARRRSRRRHGLARFLPFPRRRQQPG